ncbi:MAG: GFA family protein [Rhodospirillales bacterium]|nr:GFA family protein [Rhodospirillales bacterium]
MLLEGSCHCGAVRFSHHSHTPQPYMHCYCSICRKTAGGGGYAINLGGDASTHTVEGGDSVTVYQALEGGSERHFCKVCGSSLWAWDARWPELIHAFASAIDTPLPKPPEVAHIMLDSAASWIDIPAGPGQVQFREYPDASIEDWHKQRNLTTE